MRVFFPELERTYESFERAGEIAGLLANILLTDIEYRKWREKMATSEKKKVGDTEYFFDTETRMWYPVVDLPADADLSTKISFLRNLKLSGISEISKVEEEEALKKKDRELNSAISSRLIENVYDVSTLQKAMFVLKLAQEQPLQERIKMKEGILKLLDKDIEVKEKITAGGGVREVKIKNKKETKKEEPKAVKQKKEEKTAEDYSSLFTPIQRFDSPLFTPIQREGEERQIAPVELFISPEFQTFSPSPVIISPQEIEKLGKGGGK